MITEWARMLTARTAASLLVLGIAASVLLFWASGKVAAAWSEAVLGIMSGMVFGAAVAVFSINRTWHKARRRGR